MSHEKGSGFVAPILFKFAAPSNTVFTVNHNIGDTRPVVEVYDDVSQLRINDASVEVISSNTIEIQLLVAAAIRGTVIGAPDPGE